MRILVVEDEATVADGAKGRPRRGTLGDHRRSQRGSYAAEASVPFFRTRWRPHLKLAGPADGPTQYAYGGKRGEQQPHIPRARVGTECNPKKGESAMNIPRLWMGLLIAGSFSLGAVGCADEAKGERVTIDQLPPAAQAAIQKESQ